MASLLFFLLIGAIAGWLAGVVMRGRGFGLFGNIGVGVVGALVGGWVFQRLGFGIPAASFVSAFFGAVIVLGIANLLGARR